MSVGENIRLAVQARHPRRFDPLTNALSIDTINAETDATIRYLGLAGIEKAEAGMLSYGGQRLLDMGVALATAPRVLLLDEPLAGLAAAERERIGAIIKRISTDVPVLLVEHDIDRVFQLADQVTVMNEGRVLVDGSVEDARASTRVQEVYIGSGATEVAARPRETAARVNALLTASERQYVLRQEPHPQRCQLHAARARDRRAARPQRRRQVDAAEDADRDRAGLDRIDQAGGWRTDRPVRPRTPPASASAMCRRAAACSPA